MRRWAIEILCALVLAGPLLVLLLVLIALWMLLGLLVLVAWVMWEDMATRFVPTRSAAAWRSLCLWGVMDDWPLVAMRRPAVMVGVLAFPGLRLNVERGPPLG